LRFRVDLCAPGILLGVFKAVDGLLIVEAALLDLDEIELFEEARELDDFGDLTSSFFGVGTINELLAVPKTFF
jgi:hypothetical protein